jgi:hypothetical protein
MNNWDWPQYVIAAVYCLNLLATANLHGKPRTGKWSFPGSAISAALGVWILYMGGFWS